MTLCCVQTQIIQYSSGVVPLTAQFWGGCQTDDGLTEDEEDFQRSDSDDLKSATSADYGGVTPSATRVFETSSVSPVYEPSPPSAPLLVPPPLVQPDVAKPSLLQSSSSFAPLGPQPNLGRNPAERALHGYHMRAREAAANPVPSLRSRVAAAASQEPPPPPPVELPPAPPPPPPVLTSVSCESWEHLLTGGPPPDLQLRDSRLIRQAQSEAGPLDRILYGRMDMQDTMANVSVKLRNRRVMAFTELGLRCRSFLGPVPVGIRYPPDSGVSFGGVRRRDADRIG